MKHAILAPGLLVLVLAYSCTTLVPRSPDAEVRSLLASPVPDYPVARFAVLSDTHVFPAELGYSGKAFEAYLAGDRKLLKESTEIMEEATRQLLVQKPDFVLVSGDLTKDGERISHEWFARQLDILEAAGIKTFVTPGNHDLNNPEAVRFVGNDTEKVANVSPDDFARIYNKHGYGQALARDPSSLSYLAEPVPGLWLLSMDSIDYAKNSTLPHPVTSGRFTQSRLDWIESQLLEARRQGKAVIGMLHHTVTESYHSMKKHFGEYVLEENELIAGLLARYGVRLVFSGHYHAHDITRYQADKKLESPWLYSVMTGSLVTFPTPYRTVELSPDRITIDSTFIKDLPSFAAAGLDYPTLTREFAHTGIAGIAVETMVDLGVPREEAESLSGSIADAMLAHYAGNENFTGTEKIRLTGLSFMGGLVLGARKDLVEGLWQDLEPVDHRIRINKDGTWQP